MNQPPSRWSELQLDALREIGNIGCGRAVGALARLLANARIIGEVPSSTEVRPGALTELLGAASEPLWVAEFQLREGQAGLLLCAMPTRAAEELLGRLLPAGPGGGTALSALSEAANILASAYLDGIAALTGVSIVPSPPQVERRKPTELDTYLSATSSPVAASVAVVTWFHAEGPKIPNPRDDGFQPVAKPFRGCLAFIPTAPSLAFLFSALRLSA
ncbi:MAG: chemotaxis protein CheC [Deltaproteobacteria bacterium]